MLQNNEAKFKAHIVGGHVDKIQEFWEGLFSSPQGAELRRLHPNLRDKSPADLRYAIPLRLHEDAGPFSKGGSVNVISWSPLLAKGKELECKFIFCMYIKLAEQGAAEEAWREFIIDLVSLAEGMMGIGEPIIGDDGVNWSGIMLFGGGDLEVECLSWGLASYNQAESDCCGWCLGDRANRPLTDLRRKALWRQTESMSNDMFMARLLEKNHPICRAPWCNKYFFRLDVMHVYDHHGICCIVVGSSIKDLLRNVALGPNQEARLNLVNSLLQEFNQRSHSSVTIPPLRLDNLTLDGWAELHGPLYKSAICRHMSSFSLQLVERFHSGSDDYSEGVLLANRSLCNIYEILYSAGVFLSHAQLADLTDAVLNLGSAFQVLRKISEERGDLYWHIKPKVHIGQHLPHQCSLVNARVVQNYGEESLIGRATAIWESSCNGPYHKAIQRQTLLRYLLVLVILLDL